MATKESKNALERDFYIKWGTKRFVRDFLNTKGAEGSVKFYKIERGADKKGKKGAWDHEKGKKSIASWKFKRKFVQEGQKRLRIGVEEE